jgi:hypothetical protein
VCRTMQLLPTLVLHRGDERGVESAPRWWKLSIDGMCVPYRTSRRLGGMERYAAHRHALDVWGRSREMEGWKEIGREVAQRL